MAYYEYLDSPLAPIFSVVEVDVDGNATVRPVTKAGGFSPDFLNGLFAGGMTRDFDEDPPPYLVIGDPKYMEEVFDERLKCFPDPITFESPNPRMAGVAENFRFKNITKSNFGDYKPAILSYLSNYPGYWAVVVASEILTVDASGQNVETRPPFEFSPPPQLVLPVWDISVSINERWDREAQAKAAHGVVYREWYQTNERLKEEEQATWTRVPIYVVWFSNNLEFINGLMTAIKFYDLDATQIILAIFNQTKDYQLTK